MSIFTNILEVTENELEFSLNKSNLFKIFDQVSDKDVSIINVCNEAKNGKILNNLIIELLFEIFKENSSEDKDIIDWVDLQEGNVDSKADKIFSDNWFQEISSKRGLFLSQPFQSSINGKPSTIIIMFSSGFEDYIIYDRLYFTLQSLSLSISSCLILNISGKENQNNLVPLETCIKFSQSFQKFKTDKENNKFQTIILFIDSTERKISSTPNDNYDNFLESYLNESTINKEINYSLVKTNFQRALYFVNSISSRCAISPKNEIEKDVQKLRSFLSTYETNFFFPKLDGVKDLTGKICYDFIVSHFNSLTNNLAESTQEDSKLNERSAINFNDLKDDYYESLSINETSGFFSRKDLITLHNEFVRKVLKSLFNNDNIVHLNSFNKFLLNYIDTLTFEFKQIFNKNELKRQEVATQKLIQCCDMFLEKLKSYEKNNLVENCETNDLVQTAGNIALLAFKEIYSQEDEELFQEDFIELTKFIEIESNNFCVRINELKTVHLQMMKAVQEAVMLYETSIEVLIIEAIDKDSFTTNKSDYEKEAFNVLSTKCTTYSGSSLHTYHSLFWKKIKDINDTFLSIILETQNFLKKVQSEAFIHYQVTMEFRGNTVYDEQFLNLLHETLSHEAINNFKLKSSYRDSIYFKSYLQELVTLIEEEYNSVKTKKSAEISDLETYYKNEVLNSTQKYKEEFESLIVENQFFENKEIYALNRKISEKIKDAFKVKCPKNIPNKERILNDLSNAISEEYIRLFDENAKTKDEIQGLAKQYCTHFVNQYQDNLYDAIKLTYMENQLNDLKRKFKKIAIKEFKDANPFKNKMLITPFLLTLEENLQSQKCNDELDNLFKDHLSNHEKEIENVLREATITYREEMTKFTENSTYMQKDRLKNFHEKQIFLINSKYEFKRQNLPIEKFKDQLKATLEIAFLPILEKNNKNTLTIPAIGIDLGTTNSAVAYYKPGCPEGKEIILCNGNSNTTPSVVAFTPSGTIIGNKAKENILKDPKSTILSVKRLIGRNFSEISVKNDMKYLNYKVISKENDKAIIEVNTIKGIEKYDPEQISAKILSEMKKVAENHFGFPILNAVITVPAYFNDSQKQATKDAAEIAQIKVLDLMPEPVAAALAFHLKNTEKDKRNVLVYDLGGGTFDVAVLYIEGTKIELKALKGDNHLGGDDFDNNLVDYCLEEFHKKTNLTVDKKTYEGEIAYPRLKSECERKKQYLSSEQSETIIVSNFFNNQDLSVEILKEKFESLNKILFEKTIDLLNDALFVANLSPDKIDDVILVGGSTRIPKIREMLKTIFPNKVFNYNVNPDEAVALGASVQAALLNGVEAQELGHLTISKVAPISLGLKVEHGFMSRIIKNNTKIPTKITKEYVTVRDNQKEVEIIVYEGEEELAADNRELGRFTLEDLPPGPAGDNIIDVIFDIKDDGILFVNAKLQNSDILKAIKIKSHKGRLSYEELQQKIALERSQTNSTNNN